MTLPDYRIRFPAPLIDFAADVGLTGQAHDGYPAPGTQARYDHLRLYLIGLLTHQASFQSPLEYSEGTIWFDLNENALKTYFNNEWQDIANTIILTSEGQSITLADWYQFLVVHFGLSRAEHYPKVRKAPKTALTRLLNLKPLRVHPRRVP